MKTSVCHATISILVNCLYLTALTPAAIGGSRIEPPHHRLGQMSGPHYEWLLHQKGYDPADLGALKKAVADPTQASVRRAGLELLARRIGEESVPMLRQALDDPAPMVHDCAKNLLAMFGDEGRLARLRKDLAELTPRRSDAQIDQDTDMDEGQKVEAKRQRRLCLGEALSAAKVLAEFGDRSGYDLAKAVIEANEHPHTVAAVQVLSYISSTDPAVLQRENRGPDGVLLSLATREINYPVILAIVDAAIAHPQPKIRRTILETLVA